jgi:hypothetical protein
LKINNIIAVYTNTRTYDNITIDSKATIIQTESKFKIKEFSELDKVNYFWNHFKSLIKDELDGATWELKLPTIEEWTE